MSEFFFQIKTAIVNQERTLSPESREWLVSAVKCPSCYMCSREWSDSRKPINVTAVKAPTACTLLLGVDIRVWRAELVEILRPHLSKMDAVVGRCESLQSRDRSGKNAEYFTIYCPVERVTDMSRGKFCRHKRCPDCGRFYNKVLWARGGVLKDEVEGRHLIMSCTDEVYVSDWLRKRIAEMCSLKDVRFEPVRLLKKALDGDTIPGDVGWGGKFRERPTPKRPAKGDSEEMK